MGIVMGADTATIPSLRQAPDVVRKFFFATELILICKLFVSIRIRVQQTFPEFFLFQKSKKKSANNKGFVASWAGQSIFSIISLPIIGYRVDRLIIRFSFSLKLRSFMCIVMGPATATNTQPAASPRRCLQL